MMLSEQTAGRSRAQALRDKVEIRLAVDEAGPAIEALLKANGIELDADWSKIYPHWLIATVDDDVIGCCQVLPSVPVGYLEFLYVLPTAKFKFRAIAIRKLLMQGMVSLEMAGAQYVGGMIDGKNRKFSDVLKRMGFVDVMNGKLVARRLR